MDILVSPSIMRAIIASAPLAERRRWELSQAVQQAVRDWWLSRDSTRS